MSPIFRLDLKSHREQHAALRVPGRKSRRDRRLRTGFFGIRRTEQTSVFKITEVSRHRGNARACCKDGPGDNTIRNMDGRVLRSRSHVRWLLPILRCFFALTCLRMGCRHRAAGEERMRPSLGAKDGREGAW
jgi:hypothetical protein